jgi:hypothetical protein
MVDSSKPYLRDILSNFDLGGQMEAEDDLDERIRTTPYRELPFMSLELLGVGERVQCIVYSMTWSLCSISPSDGQPKKLIIREMGAPQYDCANWLNRTPSGQNK